MALDCQSPKSDHEKTFAVADFGADSIKNQKNRITQLKEAIKELDETCSKKGSDYQYVLRQRIELQEESSRLQKESSQLLALLPPSSEEIQKAVHLMLCFTFPLVHFFVFS